MTFKTSIFSILAVTIFLVSTGFECASTEMTSAKLAMRNKEFKKAEELLKKEISARPNNAEAHGALGNVYFDTERFVEMANEYNIALGITPNTFKPEEIGAMGARKYNGWIAYYNKFSETYNKIAIGDKKLTSLALAYLDSSEIMRPNYPDNTFSKGSIQDLADDETGATKSYTKYVNLITNDLDKGLDKGLTLGMTQEQVASKLGQPNENKIDKGYGFTRYQKDDLYVYFGENKKSKLAKVEGWKFYGDNSIIQDFYKQTSTPLRSSAFYHLGFNYYKAGDNDKSKYDDAIKMLTYVRRMDPSREDVNNILSETYIKSGKLSEAKATLDNQIASNPNEPATYINYGNLLFGLKDFYGAAIKFQTVLKLNLNDDDSRLHTALFNLGATFKNIGGNCQDSIRKVVGNKEPKPDQLLAFEKPLRESIKYFEKLKKIKGKSADFATLSELGNLYDVLNEKEQIKTIIKDLEGIENISDNSTNGQYWRSMSRLYLLINDVKKAEESDKKASKYDK